MSGDPGSSGGRVERLEEDVVEAAAGKTFAMSLSVLDSCAFGMNTPEMKYSGSTIAWTIGWAESSERMKLATANDKQQKHTAPTTTPSTNAGSVPPGR